MIKFDQTLVILCFSLIAKNMNTIKGLVQVFPSSLECFHRFRLWLCFKQLSFFLREGLYDIQEQRILTFMVIFCIHLFLLHSYLSIFIKIE